MARRSLKPQLNQIRTWVRQGRTDAWIAHQLEVSVKDITSFKREHKLESGETAEVESDFYGPRIEEEEVDLRAEDEALVAAALEEEARKTDENGGDETEQEGNGEGDGESADEGDAGGASKKRRRRRGRRGGRGRKRGPRELEGTFDHGEDGYGLWLDPAVQDDPVYAEHWAGHRAVTVSIEADQIVIKRKGDDGDGNGGDGDEG